LTSANIKIYSLQSLFQGSLVFLLIGICFVFLLFSNTAHSQAMLILPSDSTKKGTVHIYDDPSLNAVIYAKKNAAPDEWQLSGYRIQLYMGADRKQALAIKAQMLNMYPGLPIYMDYEQPYFKIRVGDYRNRFEALKTFHDLQAKFKGVSIVPDKIKYPAI